MVDGIQVILIEVRTLEFCVIDQGTRIKTCNDEIHFLEDIWFGRKLHPLLDKLWVVVEKYVEMPRGAIFSRGSPMQYFWSLPFMQGFSML